MVGVTFQGDILGALFLVSVKAKLDLYPFILLLVEMGPYILSALSSAFCTCTSTASFGPANFLKMPETTCVCVCVVCVCVGCVCVLCVLCVLCVCGVFCCVVLCCAVLCCVGLGWVRFGSVGLGCVGCVCVCHCVCHCVCVWVGG